MPTPEPPADLKQVAKLFNDTLAAIRHDAPDFGALEPYATEWLKDAQDKLMRDIQAAYYQLERARNMPLSLPRWAVDPSAPLSLWTDPLPGILEPYREEICASLRGLLAECGFPQCEAINFGREIGFILRFPAAQSTLRSYVTGLFK
ncbi:hypothetical protein B0H13DRAFT_2674666 [Mycena leptocephala]|nr:hypothetical protein B0H13DRAFT_2674666 [Mycena leptocephala]